MIILKTIHFIPVGPTGGLRDRDVLLSSQPGRVGAVSGLDREGRGPWSPQITPSLHTTHHIWADKYGYSLLMWGSVKTASAMFFSVEFITQHEKRILVCLPLPPACLITVTKESRNVTLVTINSWRKARALYYLCINLRYTGSRSNAGLPMVRII